MRKIPRQLIFVSMLFILTAFIWMSYMDNPYSTSSDDNRLLTGEDQHVNYGNIPLSAELLNENMSDPEDLAGTTVSFEEEGAKPKIYIDDSQNIFVAWIGKTPDLKKYIAFKKFYNHNQSWSPLVNISAYNNPSYRSDVELDMVVNGDTVYIAYKRDKGDGGFEIWFTRIIGDAIQDNYRLSSLSTGGLYSEQYPRIEMDSEGNVLIISRFQNSEGSDTFPTKVYARYHNTTASWDNINTWSGPFELISAVNYTDVYFDGLDAYWDSQNTLHIIVRTETKSTTTFQRSILYGKNTTNIWDNGGTYGILKNVSFDVGGTDNPKHYFLKGNDNNNYLYIGWDEKNRTNTVNNDIRIFNKTYNSDNFNSVECFGIKDQSSSCPEIAFYNNNSIAITWKDEGTDHILFKRTLKSGTEDVYNSGSAGDLPNIYVAPTNDLHFLYIDSSFHLDHRKLDITPPNIVSYLPQTGGAYQDIIRTNFTSEHDTVKVTFEYANDTDLDGVPDDGWDLINTTIRKMGVNMTADLNITWNCTFLGDKFIMFRINATDFLGLNETHTYYNITIDSGPPNLVELNRIFDMYGNDAATDHIIRGNVTIEYNVSDLVSGIAVVQLRNGTRMDESDSTVLFTTTNITLGPNGWTDTLWETTSADDGYYTQLFIRAYDRSGRWNDSQYLGAPVRIDNTPPEILQINITGGQEVTGKVNITMKLADQDIRDINCRFSGFVNELGINLTNYNVTNPLNGSARYDSQSDIWWVIWNTKNYPYSAYDRPTLDGPFILNITTEDIYNNTKTYLYLVSVDNTAPRAVFLAPDEETELPLRFNISFIIDPDTVSVEIRYKIGEINWRTFFEDPNNPSPSFSSLQTIQTELTITHYDDFIEINTTLDFHNASFIKNEDFLNQNAIIAIVVKSIDNQGLIGYMLHNITLHTKVPNQPTQLSYIVTPTTVNNKLTGSYTVRITFDSSFETRRYLIYRNILPFDIDTLNAMDYDQRLLVLGSQPGEGYCIGELYLDPSEYDKIPDRITFVDNNTASNIYYYAVIAIDDFGNPSLISEQLKVIVPAPTEKFESRSIQMAFLYDMLYIGLLSAVLLPVMGMSITRRTRRKALKRKVATEVEKISAEELLDMEIETEEEVPEIEELLEQEIEEEEEEEAVITKDAVRKCPYCGWLLSKTATRCPRCGRDLF